MQNSEITIYQNPKAEIKSYRNNYNIVIGNNSFQLERDTDFGMILRKDGSSISQRPCLFKSGAHKILTAYGLSYISEIIDSYKDYEKGLFYYEVKTTAYYNGQAVRSGFGCSNTNEKSSGFSSGWDVANTKLKIAEKRSEVDLAIKLSDASGWFVQDIEDTTNETKAKELLKDDDVITSKQIKRIFAIAANNEITQEKAKSLLAEWGFTSTKEIKQKDYDTICEKLENYNKNKGDK